MYVCMYVFQHSLNLWCHRSFLLLHMQQVELLLEIEDMLPSFILRRVQVEKHEEYPNRLSNWRTKVRNVTPRLIYFTALKIAIALALALVIVIVIVVASTLFC